MTDDGKEMRAIHVESIGNSHRTIFVPADSELTSADVKTYEIAVQNEALSATAYYAVKGLSLKDATSLVEDTLEINGSAVLADLCVALEIDDSALTAKDSDDRQTHDRHGPYVTVNRKASK